MSSSGEEDNPMNAMVEDIESRGVSKDSLSDEKENLVYTMSENERSSCKSVIKTKLNCVIISVCTIVLIFYFFAIPLYSEYSQNINISNTTSQESLTTSLLTRGNTYSKETCDDHEYGCCYIYKGCSVLTGPRIHLDYNRISIDVYSIYAKDAIKSNCPSLREIINEYNNHYTREDKGFGFCPPIDIGCDDTVHYHINDGNNAQLVNRTLENGRNMVSIGVPKNDTRGNNCWDKDGFLSGELHFINKYEHGYPYPDNSFPWVGLCFILLLLIICYSKIKAD